MKHKTLPSLRITEKTFSHMQQAMAKLNKTSLVEISTQEFRRLSLAYFSQEILLGKEIRIQKQ